MFFRFLAICLCLTAMTAHVEAGPVKAVKKVFKHKESPQPPAIKLLLKRDVEGAVLEVKGGYKLYDPNTNKKIGKGVVGKNYFIQPTMDGLKWGEGFPGVYQLVIVPNDSTTLSLVDGIQYTGKIYVYQIGNRISIVNELPVEDYVKCVLGYAVNEEMSEEALNALAIVTRTSAQYYLSKSPDAFWHIDAREIAFPGYSARLRNYGVEEAVDITKYLVLEASHGLNNGGVFDATYTENSAGKTAPYHIIFRKDGSAGVKSIETPLAFKERSKSKWTYSISKHELARKLGLPKLSHIEAEVDKNSGKVYTIHAVNEQFSKDVDFITFQKILGNSNLKSSEFQVEEKADFIRFTGYGRGSGVGLCVFSAQKMAQQGQNAADILKTFFPEAHITLCYHR